MLRLPKNDVAGITVKLKTGELFENKDITDQPFGEDGRMVSFWHNNKLRIYPMKDVEYCELIELNTSTA